MRPGARARAGFTLVELLVGMIIMSVVGASLVRMMVSQTRFMDQQEAIRVARSVSRSGLNLVMSDLRMVETGGGMVSAAAGGKDFTVRVPFAFGVVCSASGIGATVSLMPVDSALFAGAGFTGVAWRDGTGTYDYRPATGRTIPGTAGNCVGVTTLAASGGSPAGQIVDIAAILPTVPPVGSVLFLYRQVRYEFKASVAVPGREGLWRTMVSTGATEELAAPFDATARVSFYVLNNATAQTAVPAPLSNVRGLEFHLDGLSESTPRGRTGPMRSELTTSVFFENRPD